MTAYDLVVDALTAAGSTGRNGTWQCPSHDDRTPSLSVTPTDTGVLVHCHAGCPTETVVTTIGLTMADLYDEPRRNGSGRQQTATYDYTDANGRLLYQTIRYHPKDFRQRRPDSTARGGWVWNLDGVPRVLYQLPKVLAAIAAGQTVWVVEGEKDADRAAAEGVVATTCPMGAGKWQPQHTQTLARANVVVVADRDNPGIAHAQHITAELTRVDSHVTVVQPAVGKDLSDHLAAGCTLDQLEPIEPLEQLEALEQPVGPDPGRHVDLTPAANIAPRRVRWTWDHRIATGTIALLAGPEGLGKSTVAYWLAARISRGELEGEHHGTPRGVLVCATEDSWAHTIVPRLMAHGADLHRVYRIQVRDDSDIDHGLSLPADLDDLARRATEVDAALLVLDPLMSRLHEGLDTHRDGDVRRALEPLADMAETTGLAVLGIIHHNKSGSVDPLQLVMASKAFTAVARSVHTVIRDPSDDTQNTRMLGTPKNNLGTVDLPTLTFAIQPWTYPTDDGDGTTGQIAWGPERRETIAEALAATVRDPDEKNALDEAVEWLADYLEDAGGRAEAGPAQAAARAAGHAERTLRRARAKLKVEKRKVGYQGAWEWFLPTVEAAKAAKGPQDPDLGPLAPLGSPAPKGAKYIKGAKGVSPQGPGRFETGRFDNPPPDPTAGPSRPCTRCPTGTATDISGLCPNCLTTARNGKAER